VSAQVSQGLRGYAIAVVAVAAAAVLTTALRPYIADAISPLFFAAVVLACWSGGLRPGLLATALSALVTEAVFFPPVYRVDAGSLVRVFSFIVVAFLTASLYARARDARLRAEELAAAREALLKQEQAARADAETAGRGKDEFLATLSHELRTPLNALVGWLWWLRKGELDEARQARALETIERNTQALAQLIEDLLDVSRIITGKLRLKTRAVSPAPVAEAAIDAIRPAAVAKSIELVTTIDPDAGPVLADPDRLQQVMWNLLSNAIKFTPEKGRVFVTLSRAGGDVRLEVADTGKGIAPALLPYIFDRFRQSETVAASVGLGLGLSIVRHLVEVHGGRIRATSPGDGLGATFTVTLPVHAHAEADGTTTVPTVADEPRMDGLAILVVEDDPDVRQWLVQTLERWGARVATAGSGREALDAVSRERLDVLVSDIRLPDTDGYELIRKIRDIEGALGRYTPAVALTAYPRVEDRARALSAGYQMHVPKPVAPQDLASVIATLTNRHVDA
jgi:signal transduction histidine kinase/ActR/RegA family two-component response regulator